jgi:hypothetical protein
LPSCVRTAGPCVWSSFAERVGRVGRTVSVAVRGNGGGGAFPSEPWRGLVRWWAEPRQPPVAGCDGWGHECLGSLLDERRPLGKRLPHLRVGDVIGGWDQPNDPRLLLDLAWPGYLVPPVDAVAQHRDGVAGRGQPLGESAGCRVEVET